MPVSAGTVQFSYTGDGTTTVFPFPSRFLTNSDIIVGVDGVQVFTGFTVTGAGDDAGGNVTFSVAPVGATAITLIRAPSINQLLDFVNNQTVLAQNIDNGLDKLTIVAQYLSYLLDRALKLDQFDTGLTGDFDVGSRRLKNVSAPVDDTDAARLSDLQGVVAGSGNVPLPSLGQVGYALKAIAENVFGWVSEGNPLAPDGTLTTPGYGFANETNTGFLRPSAGTLQAAVLGVLRAELTASAFRLLVPLLPTNGTLIAGTDAQGQGLITTDQVTITTAAANPSGATLPTAVAGRRIVVANRGANPVNVYPASGAAIGALAANAPRALAVGGVVDFFARSATQWEAQLSQPSSANLTALAAPSYVRGDIIRRGASTLDRLGLGAARTVLGSDGTDAIWQDRDTTVGLLTTTGAATVGPWALPAGIKRFTVTSNKSSLSGTGNMLIQLRVAGAFVTSGYDSRSVYSSANISSTSGMIVSMGAATNFWQGAMDFWLHDPATNLWLCHTRSTPVTATATDPVSGSGSIALAGAIDGIQINSTAGTFDVSSFNVQY